MITRRGAWYSYGEERLGQGREKAAEFLDANPEIKKQVEEDVRRVVAERLAGAYGAKPNSPSAARAEPVLGAFAGSRTSELFNEDAGDDDLREGLEGIVDFDEDDVAAR